MANLNYSEQAKIHALVYSLSLSLCEAFVTQHLPTTLIGYVTLLTHLNNQCRLFCTAPRTTATPQRQKPSLTTLKTVPPPTLFPAAPTSASAPQGVSFPAAP
jgi:hypothetical protein